MYQIKSKLVDDTFTVLERGDNKFFALTNTVYENTEIEVLIACKNKNLIKNIHNVKSLFDGQILNIKPCEICGELVKYEQDNNKGLIWKWELNEDILHVCKE